MDLAERIVFAFLCTLGALAYGITTGGVVRKTMARIQGRVGPPIYQGFIDLGKLLFVRTATWHGYLFFFGPLFRFTGAVGFFLLVPVVVGVPALENFSDQGDVLVAMYFMFFGSLGMALGAGHGGHPNSPIGVSRGLAQMSSYEVPFSLAVVAVVASTHSFSIPAIVEAQRESGWNLFANPFASAAALISLLGMNAYAPFHLVGAPQEIPVGPATEYNSTFSSLQYSGRAIFAIAKVVLFMNLFLGGASSLLEAFVKTFVLYMWTIFIGAVYPRFRIEQSMRFFLTWPTAVGIAGVLLVLFSV